MKLAIVKLSAMGDIIHAMLALQFIKKQNPNIQIDWFVQKEFAQVLQLNPHINNIYSLDLKAIKKDKSKLISQIKLIKSYSSVNYDLIIDAQGLIKSALVSKFLGKTRAGFDRNSTREGLASFLYKIKVKSAYSKNVIERNLDVLLKPLQIEYKKEDILNKEAFLYFENTYDFKELLSLNKKNILFIVGASWPSKMYPKEKFAKISNILEENILIAWGSEKEQKIAQYICENSKAIALPKLSLNDLKSLVSKVDLVIGNDTGPTHMAWALNIPSITIFGCTPGYRNTYETKINKIVESNSKVNPEKLKKEDFSISEIDENLIVNKAKELLFEN
ncbi:lipopolysaccharide heptosyltransferase I [Halarcobacter mediterraneus]|uniref:Lipopolysaccharide heptosyltransferase 1 n=1 Tax=Halarcobacter mediterraneus TaxID=2023153 RepID=A0A4Q1ARP8_9BACT|nr:lipopolysaccharide heptosyltransferase I [Halarcobacter mediterraneus]RXK12254.1 lipopolysaccharide heptosyltransferase I [Halarcobacter mediterraneus]